MQGPYCRMLALVADSAAWARLAKSLLYSIWDMLVNWICRLSKTKKPRLMAIYIQTVCIAQSQERVDQNALDLPWNYLEI